VETQRVMFHFFRRAALSAPLKAKVGSTLAKATALRINLNIDGTPITSRTNSPITLANISSLSLGVPRVTQCM
jgi:hypothetical protein